jgi:hypothetical protein
MTNETIFLVFETTLKLRWKSFEVMHAPEVITKDGPAAP